MSAANTVSFDVIIPARYASTRLPGKPLLDLAGKTLIHRVYEAAKQSQADRVIVATDDQRIATEVASFGGEAVMTAVDHVSGTDRIAEVINTLMLTDDRIVVNLQGDEPFAPAKLINSVAKSLQSHQDAVMATASHIIDNQNDINDPNIVKVVTDHHGYALFFSRSPIPYPRDAQHAQYAKHIGIYAYRAGFVRAYSELTVSALEQTESLEQLRVLANGYKICLTDVNYDTGFGIDTQADYQRAVAQLIT